MDVPERLRVNDSEDVSVTCLIGVKAKLHADMCARHKPKYRSIQRDPERDFIVRYRITIAKHKIFQHINFSGHRRYDASTVIRIYSGIPFTSKYCNACEAAWRLAAALVTPFPSPMVKLRTEAVVLTW
jgi:hypothetical protein